jgi:hypothetical protein
MGVAGRAHRLRFVVVKPEHGRITRPASANARDTVATASRCLNVRLMTYWVDQPNNKPHIKLVDFLLRHELVDLDCSLALNRDGLKLFGLDCPLPTS